MQIMQLIIVLEHAFSALLNCGNLNSLLSLYGVVYANIVKNSDTQHKQMRTEMHF